MDFGAPADEDAKTAVEYLNTSERKQGSPDEYAASFI